LQVVERRLEKVEKVARSGVREAQAEAALLGRLMAVLSEGGPARVVEVASDEEARLLRTYNLLTAKRVLYVANVAESDLPEGENEYVAALRAAIEAEGEPAGLISLSARIEAELSELDPQERAAFLADLGLEESGLDRLIHAGYRLLGLISFFTAGEKEVRAWTIREGTRASEAA